MEVKVRHKSLKVRIAGFGAGPYTFPYFSDNETSVSQELHLGLGRTVNIIHGPVQKSSMHLVPLRMTGRAPVPVTPMEFVHGTGSCIVAFDGVMGAGDAKLATVAGVLDPWGSSSTCGVVVGTLQLVFLPQQPLHRHFGMVGS